MADFSTYDGRKPEPPYDTCNEMDRLRALLPAAINLVGRMIPVIDERQGIHQCQFCYGMVSGSHDLVGGKPCPVGELEAAIAAAQG